jgi:glycosyltransferase involved in cell wall biosynthesis
MKKYRVAYLIYSRMVGGSEMVAANLANHLDRNVFDPIILFLYPEPGEMEEILLRLNIPSFRCDMTRWKKPFRFFFLSRIMKNLAVDILHIHHVALYSVTEPCLYFSCLKGVVVTEHAGYSISRSADLQSSCRRAALKTDFLTVVSENLKKYFVDSLAIPPHRIAVIPNGIDTNRYMPSDRKGSLQDYLPPEFDGSVLITVGRLAEAKDHFTLLRAAKILKEKNISFFLFIAGDGELREVLDAEKEKMELNDTVCFLGTRTDVSDLLNESDVFVLPSKREGLPMVLLEAMATGLPVISSDVGGIGEVIENGKNGILVDAGNEHQLADAISELLSNDKKMKQLGQSGRDQVLKKYSLDMISTQYMNLYRKILNI